MRIEEIEDADEIERLISDLRRRRRELAIYRDKDEMNALREKNEALEKQMMSIKMRSTRIDYYSFNKQREEIEENLRTYEQVLARAIAEANGDDAVKVMSLRDQALKDILVLSLIELLRKKQEI